LVGVVVLVLPVLPPSPAPPLAGPVVVVPEEVDVVAGVEVELLVEGVVVELVVGVVVRVDVTVVDVLAVVGLVVRVACVVGQVWVASSFSVLAPWLRLLRRLSATPPRFCTACEKFAAADWASEH
jgi:hypothetical protein